jgi:serine/threonine protein kinase
MGQFFDAVCCIDETKLNNSLNSDEFDDENELQNYQSKKIPKNKINNIKSPERKNLHLQKYESKKIEFEPSNEFQFKSNNKDNNNINNFKFIKSLSKLPIISNNFIRQKNGRIEDDYQFIKNLGEGGYGKVIKASHKKTGMIRAIKFIPKNNLKFGYTDEDIFREIEILRNLQHPNIIKLYEFYSDNEYFYLVDEFCSEGDLSEKIVKIENFDENVVKILMFQIFQAVYYLHSKNVIHGDLKLENIMVDNINLDKNKNDKNKEFKFKKNLSFVSSIKQDLENSFVNYNNTETNENENEIENENENENQQKNKNKNKNKYPKSSKENNFHSSIEFNEIKNFELKLIDFGASKIFTKYKRNFEDTVGTLYYCSPEVLKNNYDFKCDIWSCGVLMFILLTGDIPFKGNNEEEIMKSILNYNNNNDYFNDNKKFKNLSNDAQDLIKKCFIYNSNKRISAKECINHNFFKTGINQFNLFNEELNDDTIDVLNKLKEFPKYNKFTQLFIAFITHNFIDKIHMNKIKKVFFLINKSLDGKIKQNELINAYKQYKINIKKNDIIKIFKSIDSTVDNCIEYEEFLRAGIDKKLLFTEEHLKLGFEMIDFQKKGKINLFEIKQVFGINENVDEIVIENLLEEINKKENDEINFEEFKKILNF